MEGKLMKAEDGTWYVHSSLFGVFEVLHAFGSPLLEDKDEGKIVKGNIITQLVWDAKLHKSIEIPKFINITELWDNNNNNQWWNIF